MVNAVGLGPSLGDPHNSFVDPTWEYSGPSHMSSTCLFIEPFLEQYTEGGGTRCGPEDQGLLLSALPGRLIFSEGPPLSFGGCWRWALGS